MCLSFLSYISSYLKQRVVHKIHSKMVSSEEDAENGKSKKDSECQSLNQDKVREISWKSDEVCVVPFFTVNVSYAQLDVFYQMNVIRDSYS